MQNSISQVFPVFPQVTYSISLIIIYFEKNKAFLLFFTLWNFRAVMMTLGSFRELGDASHPHHTLEKLPK